MKLRVKCFYREGVRLTVEELAETPCYIGKLIIEDWGKGGASEDVIRLARLVNPDVLDSGPSQRDVIPPLFEPTSVRMANNLRMLDGYQIHVDSKTGAVHRYSQCWMLYTINEK
jgi:hypothetical protein